MKHLIAACLASVALLTAPTAIAQSQQVTLGVALASDTNPFYILMKRGIDARAKELGLKVVYVTANEVAAQQVNGISDLVARKVSGILVSPIDAVAINSAYDTAAKAGIPIISVARHATTPSQSAFVTMDEKQIGRDTADWIIKRIGGKGKIAMIAGPAGAATFRNLNEGFEEVIKANNAVSLVYKKDGPLTREHGLKQAEDILVTHPDIAAIYGANDEVALGAAQAVTVAGKTGKVAITGMNGVPAALKAIKAGQVGMTVFLNPSEWGRLGVDTMAAYLKGHKPSADVKIKHVMVDQGNVERMLAPTN